MKYTFRKNFLGQQIRKQMLKEGYGETFKVIEEFYQNENVYRDEYIEPYEVKQVKFVKFVDDNDKEMVLSLSVFNTIMECV